MKTFDFMKKIFIIGIFLSFAVSLESAELKKVLIMDIINIEKNSNYQYLEVSITDAVAQSLKEKFAFKEAEKKQLENLAEENYFYRDDFYTKSIAMNTGLLSKQDVVISGGFKIISSEKAKSSALKKEKGTEIIATKICILDIAKKKVIAEFVEEGPADSRIFESVEKIAVRISQEAKAVLPSREDWEKKGISTVSDEQWFERFVFGIRIGGGIYFNGWASHFKLKQPSLGLSISFYIPVLWEKLLFQVDFIQAEHVLKKEAVTVLNAMDLTLNASNYFLAGNFMFDYHFWGDFNLYPKLGAGYALQQTQITGSLNSTSNNSFPIIEGGLETTYKINRQLSAVLAFQTFMEIEKGVYTYFNNLNLGINYGL